MLKPLTPVLLLFQHCIKAENFKVSVNQEDAAFSWTEEALIKIGFILECFSLHFNQKEVTEVERNVKKLVISLIVRRSINL